MSDVIDFCILILQKCIDEIFFSIDLTPGVSFGAMMVAVLVTEVFVSSLVVSFRKRGAPVPGRRVTGTKVTEKEGGL